MKVTYKIFPILFFFLFVPKISGQDIELYIKPYWCHLHQDVRIYGFAKPGGKKAYVRLELKKPISGKTLSKRIRVNKNGEYDFIFKGTNEHGKWKVKVIKEGSNQSISGSFIVESGTFLLKLNNEIENLNNKTNKSFNNLFRLIVHYPQFPGKQEMEAKIKSIISKTNELKQKLTLTDDAIRKMEKELKKSGTNLPKRARQALSRAFTTSVKAYNFIEREMPEIDSMIEETKKESEWCYIWLLYRDLCNKLSFINNFIAKKLKDICQNLLIAKATQGMPFEISQSIGTTIHLITSGKPSPIGLINYLMGTISSLGSAVYGELAKNCAVYKGECVGDYSASLLHKGAPFFTMSYKITGEMMLTFKNRRTGDPRVYLKGRFKGHSEGFKSSITMIPFTLPSSFTLAWSRCPVPLIARRSFLLYLKGEAMDDRLKIKLENSAYDFKLKARGYYVILSAHSSIPVPGSFEFPLMNSEWILTRVTKVAGKPNAYIDLPIKIKGKNTVIEKNFTRKIYLPSTPRRKAIKVKMKFKINLKNSQ